MPISENDFSKFLAPATAEVLTSLSEIEEIKNYTLVGGSALSIYLHHRISEDLDFFTWQEKLEMTGIDPILKKAAAVHQIKTINTYSDGLDILVNNVKVTFFANYWERLKEREELFKNSYIGKLELITAMKTNALSLRAAFRDYYDLYVITKTRFDIKRVLDIALEYIPGMTRKIFAMQLIYTDDIYDEDITHLHPVHKVSLDDIRSFFENEIKKIL